VSISSTFLHTNYLYERRFGSFSSYVLALAKNLYKKCARKMLMKMTPGFSRYYVPEKFQAANTRNPIEV